MARCLYLNMSVCVEHTFICTMTTFITLKNRGFRASNYPGTRSIYSVPKGPNPVPKREKHPFKVSDSCLAMAIRDITMCDFYF